MLVTVEREGVLEAFVRTVKRGEPTIDVPIKPELRAQRVRLRVRRARPHRRHRADGADRPREARVQDGAGRDPRRLVRARTGGEGHAGAGRVQGARQGPNVAIAVRRADGSAPPKGAEVALAAVDEGLLELLPNDSWKLLDAMMTRRGEEVGTSTAQMQVIGKRHFGRKAIATGGGGGRGSSRELFDTLLAVESARAARRRRQRHGRSTAQRFADQLSHRRGGQQRRAAFRYRQRLDSLHPGSDAACRACRRWCAKAIAFARSLPCATRPSASSPSTSRATADARRSARWRRSSSIWPRAKRARSRGLPTCRSARPSSSGRSPRRRADGGSLWPRRRATR